MTAIYSATEQTAAIAAADAAADGSKRSAFLTSWQTAIGSNAKVVLYRDGTPVYTGTLTGTLTITDNAFVIETASQSSISAADIDTGAWELRIENAADAAIYFGCTVTRAGGTDVASLDDDLEGSDTLDIGTLTFNAPPLDTSEVAAEQIESVVTGTNVGSLTLTLTSQPTAQNKIVIPFAYYEGFRGYDDPTDVGATLWLDPSDLSSLRANTDGTGSVTGANQLVRRIANKGSAGGYFTSSVGWYLRQTEAGVYYLEAPGTSEFVSNLASSSFIGASAGEVIIGWRTDDYYGSSDSWYSYAAWEADDGIAGVTFHTATTARMFNYDGSDDYVQETSALDADQVLTWVHTGGNLKSALGFESDPATSTASGNSASLSSSFAIGGVYHGSFPRGTGRFYGIVAKTAALTTAERDFVQWYVYRKMTPFTSMAAPTVTDNAGNSYTVVATKTDAANRVMSGVAVCHTVAAGSGTFTATMAFSGSKGFSAAASISEFSGLTGSASLDKTGVATNDASGGSLEVTTTATSQAMELVVSAHGIYNGDSDANMTTPSGYTSLGIHDAADSVVGFSAGYKVVTSIGAQSATGTWDAGSSGGAAAVLATFRAGDNTDPPSGGGGGGSTELTVNSMALDMNAGVNHEMYLDGVNPDWGWGSHARMGVGINPPQASGWGSPQFVPWGVAATERNNPPTSHNWRLAIHRAIAAEKRNGQWAILQDITSPSGFGGAFYTDYETNAQLPADKRTSNGYLEVWYPDSTGGSFHFYTTRFNIPATGAQHRVAMIQASLTVEDGGESDDRSSARVVMLCGGDYWRAAGVEWGDGYSNDDFAIGRASKPALYPDKSWHTSHTMTNEADIQEFIAWLDTQGVI